ncbi:hypothetical protein M9Y10_025762 [Tritrichomonas musculus]|uniref:Uncharacterized protein n=1 Tax=Tritrichomonas musculus TaxID=1915356 RepID=A0ABR2HAF9_9EUKA
MFALFCIFIQSQFNLLTINGKPASEFAGKGRPVFLRMLITGCPFALSSVAQWEQASKLFPQVDFVTYDCWKDEGQGVCKQFLEGSSSPYHVLIQPDKLVAYPDGFGNPPDISESPQRFINTIVTDTGLYPLAPPILSLFPKITDSFYNSSKNPIFLIYDSTRIDHSQFASAWSKVANEELYPEDDSISFGLLDSSKYPEECMRWTQSEKLESPVAVIYSRETGNFVKLTSYFSIVSDVRRNIINLNLISTIKKLPDPVIEKVDQLPVPTPLPNDYKIVTNEALEKRSLSTVKTNYLNTFNFKGQAYTGQPADDKTCNQVTPSPEDHAAALKVLNYLRNLAGLSDNIVEDPDWNTDCQDTALIIHKIGTVPSNHVIIPELIPKTCTQGNEFIQTAVKTAALSNLASNDDSCYQSMYRFILDEGANNRFVAGHRRSLFHPKLEKVGMGFYPVVNEPYGTSPNTYMQKPAVTVLRALNGDQTQDTEELPANLNFVSWPSAGPFPIDQLPSTWTISFKGFRAANLKSIDDLDIYITRDDGTPIPFTAKLSLDLTTKDTLSLYLDQTSLELCQEMRTITVQIVNNNQKYSLKYSFTLFGKGEQTDICLYATDDSKCPSEIPKNLHFSQDDFASNENVNSIINGKSNVLVYVAENADIGDEIMKLSAPRIFFKNSKVFGTFEIGVSSIVSFEDPSSTDFIIDWNPLKQVIGYLSTSGSPSSVIVTQIVQNEAIDYQSLPFYDGKGTDLLLNETIIHFREKDVFNSFNYINGEFYACTYALKSIAEYSVGYDKYYDAPNSILVPTNKDMENQHTYRKRVKIYTSEEDLNTSLFMIGEKKDYIIIAPKVGQEYYFYCSPEAENRINSLTIEPDPYNPKYSTIKRFDLARVDDIRKKCNIQNVVINGVPYNGFSDTNQNAFSNIQGDSTAVTYYSDGVKRNFIMRPKPTTNSNFPGQHVLDIQFDKSEYGNPSSSGYNPIIYTPGDYSEYTIIQPEIERNDYIYNTYEFRPAPGAESKPVTLNFYREIGGVWEFAPKFYNDFKGIWFTGYSNITIHFNSEPLNHVDGKFVPYNALDKYHYDSCQSVTFIGTKEIPVPDPENTPPPQELNAPIEIKQDQPSFSFSNGNPYQIIKPDSVIISATTVFEAKNVETPIVNVQPQTYSTIKEMKITKSIEVDSGSITLNKCNLADGINISMKKDLSWPQISLVDTTINPEAIDIDVGLTSAKLLDDAITDTEPHVVVDGIENGKCEDLNSHINLQNNGNYKHYCFNDNQIIVSQLSASNFATPEPPTPIPPSTGSSEPEKPVLTESDEEEIPIHSEEPQPPKPTNEVGNNPDDDGKNNNKGLSTGAIVGIVVGCVCGVALVVGLVVYFVLRKSKERTKVEDSGSGTKASYESNKTFPI